MPRTLKVNPLLLARETSESASLSVINANIVLKSISTNIWQYLVSCGFCFNCGVERPGHDSGSCPEPPAWSKCLGRHLSILHTDKAQYGRRPNPLSHKESNAYGDKLPAIPHPASHEGSNTSQTASTNLEKPKPIPISSARLSTTETQVLLNLVPVIITAVNGNTVSTYAFLDSGCTDTLIDRGLVDHLGIQGIP